MLANLQGKGLVSIAYTFPCDKQLDLDTTRAKMARRRPDLSIIYCYQNSFLCTNTIYKYVQEVKFILLSYKLLDLLKC